jgi:hypothetical protein
MKTLTLAAALIGTFTIGGIVGHLAIGEPERTYGASNTTTAPMISMEPGAYSLIRVYEDGSEWVADYNLGLGDCVAREAEVRSILPSSRWKCERQPYTS